jgi:undecaprenyl phosphate N,N'-diacetylbacillosamine 1-phosphate transferase
MNLIYRSYIKKSIDLVSAIFLLILTIPITLPIIIFLMISLNGKCFFKQERIGKDNQLFMIVKFITMSEVVDENKNLLPDELRITKFGKFIRNTSIDELPQLINILKGEMSFIGPRPLLKEYLPYYSEEQIKRHLVTPGITGWAQVNGRNAISWDEKFELDLYYINHQSFLLDLKISLLSVIKIVKSEGIRAEGHATMPKFSDYRKEINERN